MAYTPTEWQTGDVVTAEKLNKIEGGIEECSSNTSSVSGLVETSIDTQEDVMTINKSFNDLVAITQAGVLPFFSMLEDSESYYGYLSALKYEDDMYMAEFIQLPGTVVLFSLDPDSFMTTRLPQDQSDDGDDIIAT